MVDEDLRLVLRSSKFGGTSVWANYYRGISYQRYCLIVLLVYKNLSYSTRSYFQHPAAMLNTICEKAVQPTINPDHVAYCPTMDLIALATIEEKVHVFRFNGQKVFGVTSKDPLAKVNQIKWKPNGESDAMSQQQTASASSRAQAELYARSITCGCVQ